MGTRRKQVFLSYAREDLQRAARLYGDLNRDPEVHIWFDQRDLLPGIKWRPAIRKAIRESTSFVALFSRQSAGERGYRHKELSEALDIVKEFPEDQIFLIPTKLEECDVPIDEVGEYTFAKLFPDWDEGVKSICLAAGIRSSKGSKRRTATLGAPQAAKLPPSVGRAYKVKVVLLSRALPKMQGVLSALNAVQSFFNFSLLELSPPSRAFTKRDGEPQLYIDRLTKPFYARMAPLETDHVICVTDRFLAFDRGNKHFYNFLGYIGEGDERVAFASLRGLDEHAARAGVPIARALSYGLVSDVVAYFLDVDWHAELRGCPLDYTKNHADMATGLHRRRFCAECSKLLRKKSPQLHSAVQAMLDWNPDTGGGRAPRRPAAKR